MASSRNAPLGEPTVVDVVLLAVVVVGAAVVVVVGAAVVVVGAAVVVVVDAAVVVVGAAVVVVVGAAVVVVVLSQTNTPSDEPAPQESQQLVAVPTQAWPPGGGWHFSARDLIEHFTLPR